MGSLIALLMSLIAILEGMTAFYYGVTTICNYLLKGTDGLIRVGSFSSCCGIGGILGTFAAAIVFNIAGLAAYGAFQHDIITRLSNVVVNSFGPSFQIVAAATFFALIALFCAFIVHTSKKQPQFIPFKRPMEVAAETEMTKLPGRSSVLEL